MIYLLLIKLSQKPEQMSRNGLLILPCSDTLYDLGLIGAHSLIRADDSHTFSLSLQFTAFFIDGFNNLLRAAFHNGQAGIGA